MKKAKKIMLISASIAVCIMLVFSLGGCAQRVATKMIEKALEQSGAGDVDIDLDEGEVNITDEEGNEMSIGGADLPEDWPSVVPVSKDIDVQSSFSQTVDGKKGWTVIGLFKGSGESLYEYYKKEFSGWDDPVDLVTDQGDDGKTYHYQASSDKYFVVVWVFESDDEKSITLSVNEQ
jgi:hypothetical protein